MTKAKPVDAKDRATGRSLIPLVALGSGFAAGPAAALELGELTVHSNLGQPLRASIAYALAPNEMLADTCVSINAGRSTGGLPGIGPSTVSVTESAIVIRGNGVIREPMLGTRVTINCPYTPNLSREYMLFVDPAPVAAVRAASEVPVAPPVARREVEPANRPAAATPVTRRAPVNDTPIGQSTRYQVQPGDTLGDIVQRIENRSMSLWPAVNLVFEANPDSFIDDDPNKLKAGSWLTIPSFDGSAPVVGPTAVVGTAAAPAAAAPTAATGEVPLTETLANGETVNAAASEAIAAYDRTVTEQVAEPAIDDSVPGDGTGDLKPGDVIIDTQLEGPQTSSSSPNVPTAIISTGARSESTSLLTWLIGGGLGIIAALILFGRRMRGRHGAAPVDPIAAAPVPSSHDGIGESDAIAVHEYYIEDDSPTEENLALDGDLVTGDGFDDGVEMDIAQDFGFAATSDLDVELPFEPEAAAPDHETDIIAPVRVGMESILESEVLPEDDDYDMSVIIDATQMPQPEDVTERDLKAVEVGSDDETSTADNYTISQEVDYDLLEQDYEDELTATQALNQEIERAAAELAGDLGEDAEDTASLAADEETSEMPLATVTELDVTERLPAGNDTDPTVEMDSPRNPNDTAAVTVNMSADEKTAEMPVANDDDTADLEIEGGLIDTKNG